MKKVKVGYVDFWKGFVPEEYIFHKILSRHYEVEITNRDPDFIICSTFGNQYLKYVCPRLLFVGEAFCPDFNVYDYAIGFDRINFGDRYLRYPLSLVNKEILELALHKHERPEEDFTRREKFCSFVVSSGGGVDDIRNWFFDKISEYKQVDSGGRFRNNLPDGQPVPDKKAFQEQYRFSLAFENTSFPGYTTEKILDAWAAGTIPIYYGDPGIIKDFNEKAMIVCRGRESLDEVLDKIKELEENTEKYLETVRQPIITDQSEIKPMLQPDYLENFLIHIFDQEPQQAFRRNSKLTMWGQFYEYRIKKWDKIDHLPVVELMRKWKRKIFGLKIIVK